MSALSWCVICFIWGILAFIVGYVFGAEDKNYPVYTISRKPKNKSSNNNSIKPFISFDDHNCKKTRFK